MKTSHTFPSPCCVYCRPEPFSEPTLLAVCLDATPSRDNANLTSAPTPGPSVHVPLHVRYPRCLVAPAETFANGTGHASGMGADQSANEAGQANGMVDVTIPTGSLLLQWGRRVPHAVQGQGLHAGRLGLDSLVVETSGPAGLTSGLSHGSGSAAKEQVFAWIAVPVASSGIKWQTPAGMLWHVLLVQWGTVIACVTGSAVVIIATWRTR